MFQQSEHQTRSTALPPCLNFNTKARALLLIKYQRRSFACFWYLTPCTLVEGHQHFRGTWALNKHSTNLPGNSKKTQSRECVFFCLTYGVFLITFKIIGVNETEDSRILYGKWVSTWKNSVPTGWIFMKFVTLSIYRNPVEKIQV